MASKLQIFISSTYSDMPRERQAAVEAILKAGHIPAGMELFTAGNKSQWEVIQRWISESDVYVLILGGRYGSIEPTSGKSYIELEYDLAVASEKPFFSIVISEPALEDKVKANGSRVIEQDEPAKLRDFRARVLKKMCSFYTDEKDIKLAILESIPTLAAEYNLQGWVRASELVDTKALTDELLRLHNENKKLGEQLAKVEKNKDSQRENTKDEFNDLLELLWSTKLDITPLRRMAEIKLPRSTPDEVPLGDLMHSFRDTLITGVQNSLDMSEIDNFLYFVLCPRLQTYDLVQNEKVAGVRYRRYVMTKKGMRLLAYIDKRAHDKNTTGSSSSSISGKKASKGDAG